MKIEDIKIRRINESEDYPYDLLFLADPYIEMLNVYLDKQYIYVGESGDSIIAVYALYPIDKDTIEIKNIAVDEQYHNQGIGKKMLTHAESIARQSGYKTIIIGTGNNGFGQLYLYQKQGFEMYDIKPNFFTDNYPEPIWENGIQCKHMVMLRKYL